MQHCFVSLYGFMILKATKLCCIAGTKVWLQYFLYKLTVSPKVAGGCRHGAKCKIAR
uniref:Uncharacterized protein n=1 Tax=Anguilla anguilla TaxID=7936 RepID=A0A0E9X8D6_ANGAN